MKKLTIQDETKFLALMNQNPSFNLFFVGDYYAYGFDDPVCQYYGAYEGEVLTACVMRYRDSIHLSGHKISDQDLVFIQELMKKHDIRTFNTSETFSYVIEALGLKQDKIPTMLSVFDPKEITDVKQTVGVLPLEYLDEYIELMALVFNTPIDKATYITLSKEEKSITYAKIVDGKLVSCASATAFTPDAAMIVGVMTHPDYRSKGYARETMLSLCQDMGDKGRKSVLFYNNPVAGKMYHALGFVDQEPYYMVKIKP